MATQLTRRDLTEALDFLDWVDAGGTTRELAALVPRLEDWLPPSDEIPLPGGGTVGEPGLHLGESTLGTVWLLSHGRVLVVGAESARRPEPTAIVDVDAVALQLTDRLRSAVLSAYLGDTGLEDLPPTLVFRTVSELLETTRDLNPAGRELVVRALSSAMRPGEGWDAAAVRLRTGLEGLLGDRSPAVVDEATRALVRIAVGLGPRPPAGDPSRGLVPLLGAPRPHVRAAALRALRELPVDALRAAGDVLEPRLQGLLADDDYEVRRLASAVERHLGSGGPVGELAARLESPDRQERIAALQAWAEGAVPEVELLLPLALDAAEDPDDEVSAAARAALASVAQREGVVIRRLVAHGLLAARDPRAVHAGCETVKRYPESVDAGVVAALREALEGDAETRTAVAEALAEAARMGTAQEAADLYDVLLWHGDPAVRKAALGRIGQAARDRLQVREALVPAIVEHLEDPVPAVRIGTARALAEMGVPNAGSLIAGLAFDADAEVRRGALQVLTEMGSPLLAEAERRAALADTLFGLAAGGRPDDRVHWAGALDRVMAWDSARVTDVLVGLLRRIPDSSGDPFVEFALQEIDRRLLDRSGCGTEFVEICRHLMAPPEPRPDHAARLAAGCAAEEPTAFDLLWTMYTAAEGAAAAAARDALGGLVDVPKSRPVAEAIHELMELTESSAERSLLRMLLRG